MSVVMAVVLALTASLVLFARHRRRLPVRRLAALRIRAVPVHGTQLVDTVPPLPMDGARRPLLLRGSPLLVAAAGWLLVGGRFGAPVGMIAGVAGWLVLRRLPGPAIGRERREAAADLPYAVDLLAAALRAGAPLDRALTVVGVAVGGSLGRRFDEVGRALRLGVHGVDGWRPVADVPGSEALIAAAVRAAESGSTLAAACSRAATDLRERRDAEADAAAQRAGVLIVLPLGACFLPAFVLVGVVPILLGVLDDVLL